MAKSEKFKRLEAVDEIDFLCHDDTDTLFERQLVRERLREFDPDDLEFIGRKFRGYKCPVQGTEVQIGYYTTYIQKDGDERVTSIQFVGPTTFGDLFSS